MSLEDSTLKITHIEDTLEQLKQMGHLGIDQHTQERSDTGTLADLLTDEAWAMYSLQQHAIQGICYRISTSHDEDYRAAQLDRLTAHLDIMTKLLEDDNKLKEVATNDNLHK